MKTGDVVQLKCGGPKMVIREDQGVNENENVHWFTCEYFENGVLIIKDFPESSLSLL
ncbi:MAG: DUF2158 domain-containing protein [Bacteroidales bacterium]|nr:DUF2158 domain-containing protein [Bacteroidales bacterium]